MTIFRDLSIIWSLFHILILFMMLYRSRYPRRKTVFLTAVAMGFLIVLNMAGVAIYGTGLMGKLFLLTCTLPSLVFFWFISKDKKGKFFFTFCLADTVALWILSVTNVLDYYFGGQQYILMFVGRLVLFPLVEWVAAKRLRKPYLELQESVAEGWGIFAGMTALYYVMLAVTGNFPVLITSRPQEIPAFILILLLMPMTYATIFTAMYRQLQLYRKQQSERILQEQKNLLEAKLENQQRIRRMRHDMKGHTAMLSGLLAAGKTQEAKEYLEKVKAQMDTAIGRFSVNPYINAVVSHYDQKLQELGVQSEFDIQIGDETLPYMELCQILSNGLENVCDALPALDADKREASVKMRYHKNHLIIRIKNSCRQDLVVEKGKLPGTDKEGYDHGFGLRTIEEAAKRLGGDMLCYTENGNFVLDVMTAVDL